MTEKEISFSEEGKCPHCGAPKFAGHTPECPMGHEPAKKKISQPEEEISFEVKAEKSKKDENFLRVNIEDAASQLKGVKPDVREKALMRLVKDFEDKVFHPDRYKVVSAVKSKIESELKTATGLRKENLEAQKRLLDEVEDRVFIKYEEEVPKKPAEKKPGKQIEI